MSLLRAAIRSNPVPAILRASHGLPFLLPEMPRRFSTEAEQPPHDSTVDPFLQTPSSGLAYGRLLGVNRHTLRTDIINLLEGCNLTLDDLKVEYNRSYNPMAMLLQFRSGYAYDQAIRDIQKKGRLYRLEKADRSQWDILTPHDGKSIFLQGIPRNALLDDIERFLCGCDYDHSSINMFMRAGIPESTKLATVGFPSRTEAMNAFITKNRSFCLNNQVTVRVLQ